jgi:hypothetical protein
MINECSFWRRVLKARFEVSLITFNYP